MALILDFAVVIILILSVASGWNKGFLRYIVSSVGTIAAIIISFLLADIFAPTVYEKWIQPEVRDFIEEKIDKFDVSNVVAKEIKDCGYNLKLSDKELDTALSSDGDISLNLAKLAGEKRQKALRMLKNYVPIWKSFLKHVFRISLIRFLPVLILRSLETVLIIPKTRRMMS